MSAPERLDPARTALLFFDMLNGHVRKDDATTKARYAPVVAWSAFHQTYLDLALRSRNIDTLVISGGSTDVGVASTAYAARDLDYNLVIVSDACTSPEEDNHRQFVQRIFPRMARVRTAEQVVRMLAG